MMEGKVTFSFPCNNQFFRLFRRIRFKTNFSMQRTVSFFGNFSFKITFEELILLTVEKHDVSLGNNCGLCCKLSDKRMIYIYIYIYIYHSYIYIYIYIYIYMY